MHGSIGPSCSIGLLKDGTLTVWTHSQGVYPLRDALAEMLDMPKNRVRCIHIEGSGCYGHNGADDVAAHAALFARAMPGRPVRVVWMRDQEHTWEPYTPAMVTEMSASLNMIGRIVDWQYALWSSSHNERIVNAGRLMPATQLERPFVSAPSVPMVQPEGGGDRNAIPLYAVPNIRVENNFSPTMPLRTSALRGLGAHMNVFSIESFMDELAMAAHVDPVQFRLTHLDDQRAIDVIKLAAKEFGWPRAPRHPRAGVGFTFAKYKNLMAYVAIAVEISVEPETGTVHLEEAVAAVDTGQIVNPDGVKNQIEGVSFSQRVGPCTRNSASTLRESEALTGAPIRSCGFRRSLKQWLSISLIDRERHSLVPLKRRWALPPARLLTPFLTRRANVSEPSQSLAIDCVLKLTYENHHCRRFHCRTFKCANAWLRWA